MAEKLSADELTAWTVYVTQLIQRGFDFDRPPQAAQNAGHIADMMLHERRKHAGDYKGAALAVWDGFYASMVITPGFTSVVGGLDDAAIAAGCHAAAKALKAVMLEYSVRSHHH
jgi:hypothetical protein